MNIAPATSEHFPAVCELLEGAALTVADLDASLPGFFVMLDGAQVMGVGGLERLDMENGALIRSVVVHPDLRGRGLGWRIYEQLETRARQQDVKELYLLTETAETFFAAQGFEVLAREAAPEALQATPQFAELCPASATVMHKAL